MTATTSFAGEVQRMLSSALLHPSRFSFSRTGREGQIKNRVLLIGDRQALTSRHDPEVRLADHLADAVVARTGRGLQLDSVWDLIPVLRAIGNATRAHRRWQYDAVVVLIHNTPTRRRSVSPTTIHRHLTRVLSRLGPATAIELVFLDHPGRNAAGRAAHRFSQEVMTGLDNMVNQVQSITVPSGLIDAHRDAAAAVADSLVPRLGPPDPSTAEHLDANPPNRSRPRATGNSRAASSAGLQRVVTMAVRSFGVPFAAVSLFDGPDVHTVAHTWGPIPSIDGLLHAFEHDGGGITVVPDTNKDPRTVSIKTVAHGTTVRFWAAYPIETTAGQLLGAVSVFDTVPRDLDTEDELMLHDLAQLAGAEVDSYRPDD